MEQFLTYLYSIIITFLSNYHILKSVLTSFPNFLITIIVLIYFLYFPTWFLKPLTTKQLTNIRKGYMLLEIFFISNILSSLLIFTYFKLGIKIQDILINYLIILGIETVIFLNGITRIYLFSKQVSIKYKVFGVIIGLIPIIHIPFILKVIKVTKKEVKFENDKIILNESRKNERLCKTKYPILLVHGVFFRDSKFFDYWGRIPEELKTNGATIYYGEGSSALSVKKSAEELAKRVKEILQKENVDKANIIAHSKGGLDARYAISECGIENNVASLTMINTPNKGCVFADYLLSKMPKSVVDNIAKTYNFTLKHLGDENPDFVSAVNDLTSSSCVKLNKKLRKSLNVFYQSYGSKLIKSNSARFPLNLTTNFVKYFDGDNDGLVGEKSFAYGDKYTFLVPTTNRGISHGDMIDLNRENIDGFDVREFYVKLVNDLKKRGF